MKRMGQSNKMELETNEIIDKKDWININMYDIPPEFEYTLSKMTQISQDRIKVYKKVDNFLEEHRSSENEKKDFYLNLTKTIQKISYKFLYNRDDDLVSHWLLKMVFCKTDQGYFFMQEGFIFSARLSFNARNYGKAKLKLLNFDEAKKEPYIRKYVRQYFFDLLANYCQIDPMDKNIFTGKKNTEKIEDNNFKEFEKDIRKLDTRVLEIPFKYCHRLFDKYKVVLKKGKALITPETAFPVLQELFNEILFIHTKNIKKIYNSMKMADERVSGIIDILTKYNKSTEHYFKSNKPVNNLSLKLSNIDIMAKKHFPLCMSEILTGLRKKHMLKHWGRLQLGMFLKGIGLNMKDNVNLFSLELKKTREGEKKINEYKYYIEHMYGKRGKKTDYTPWSCQKVANKAIPNNGEYFGCPFKYYSDSNLGLLLKHRNFDRDQIDEVNRLRKLNYNLGCRKVFEVLHPEISKIRPGVGKHPNSYYMSSYYYHKKRSVPNGLRNLTK